MNLRYRITAIFAMVAIALTASADTLYLSTVTAHYDEQGRTHNAGNPGLSYELPVSRFNSIECGGYRNSRTEESYSIFCKGNRQMYRNAGVSLGAAVYLESSKHDQVFVPVIGVYYDLPVYYGYKLRFGAYPKVFTLQIGKDL